MKHERPDSIVERASNWIDVDAIAAPADSNGIVGNSAPLRAMLATIARVAPYKGSVLVTGESGSGKELVTRALHRLGPYAQGPFVSVNCSNLVDGLAESQLFGHVKGAFTDARQAHHGYFRQANGGTLFLDEIGDLPAAMQAKLLRAAESFEIQPVGGPETFRVEVRLLTATNRDLRAMVNAGSFRADLYYRLDVISVRIPPLRERREDVGALVAHFIEQYNRAFGKHTQFVSRRALDLLQGHCWPGNVRELAHVIERASLLSEHDRIDLGDLPEDLLERIAEAEPGTVERLAGDPVSKQPVDGQYRTLDDTLKEAVERSLIAARGDCAEAARLLGISRPAIYRRMARFGINGGSLRRVSEASPGEGPATAGPASPSIDTASSR